MRELDVIISKAPFSFKGCGFIHSHRHPHPLAGASPVPKKSVSALRICPANSNKLDEDKHLHTVL